LSTQQLGYCTLNKINSLQSKKKLNEVDTLTMPDIQGQLYESGLRSAILDGPVISKMAWKRSIRLPKGKDFDQEIRKRAGILSEKEKPGKRQKTKAKQVDEDEDTTGGDIEMEEEEGGVDVEEEQEGEDKEAMDQGELSWPQVTQATDLECLDDFNIPATPEAPSCIQQRFHLAQPNDHDMEVPPGYFEGPVELTP